MPEPFWKSEQDLSDSAQERLDPDTNFEGDNPDGAAASIPAAAELEYADRVDDILMDRARAMQQTNNDPAIPDRFEDDVYTSQQRAERAVRAVFARGLGAAQDSRGVESPVRWGIARVDEFGGLVNTGAPDDEKYVQDNDLLPFGHEDRTVEDPPGGLDDTPFVDGVPDGDRREELDSFVNSRL